MKLSFRPHHFLCTFCFEGSGYSPEFISNYTAIVETLHTKEGAKTPIQVVAHADAICMPCPHRRQGQCETEDKIAALDQAHANALNVQTGDTLTWEAAQDRIKKNINLPTFHEICATCNWKPLGICEKKIQAAQERK